MSSTKTALPQTRPPTEGTQSVLLHIRIQATSNYCGTVYIPVQVYLVWYLDWSIERELSPATHSVVLSCLLRFRRESWWDDDCERAFRELRTRAQLQDHVIAKCLSQTHTISTDQSSNHQFNKWSRNHEV